MSAKKLVLIVIDGLTPAALEEAVEREDVPTLRFLVEHGEYRRVGAVGRPHHDPQ